MSEPVNRYEFLRSLWRGGLLLGLAGLSTAAIQGTKDPSECIDTGYCAACRIQRACTLPEKRSVKDDDETKTRPA